MVKAIQELFEKLKIYGPSQFVQQAIFEIYLIIWARGIRGSYSQRWEDLTIDRLLNKKKGFYVDIGANDPIRMNNTYRFYKKGWWGINIEPNPDCIYKLQKIRKRDINLNIGISMANKKMSFFRFLPSTISTFSRHEALGQQRLGFKFIDEIKIPVMRLTDVLNRHCEKTLIDFMSIDTTEEYEFITLRSNDWQRFRPKVVCIEAADHDFSDSPVLANKRVSLLSKPSSFFGRKERIKKYLLGKGYKEYLYNGLNIIFIDTRLRSENFLN